MNNNRLKIGVIGTRGIPNRYGGFERFVEQLVENNVWATSNTIFYVYGESRTCEKNAWVKCENVGCSKSSNPIMYYLKSAVMATRDCDIVLCCGVGLSIFSFLVKINGRKLIINPDGCEWRRSKWSRIGRLLIKMMYVPALYAADKIVIDAKSLADDFWGCFKAKYKYIAYQAPTPAVHKMSQSTIEMFGISKKYILIIARLEPENNILLMIFGFKKYISSDVEMLIVGAKETIHYTNELKMHQTDRIRFLGPIYSQMILNELRSNCFIYAHGHSVGGTNPSLLEALSSVNGTILCHDNKYNREVAGCAASYFKGADEFAELVKTACSHPELQSNQRQPSREEKYNPDFIALEYKELFNNLDK
jgi:glycosyltransferase involved in cell wall biosynthesis